MSRQGQRQASHDRRHQPFWSHSAAANQQHQQSTAVTGTTTRSRRLHHSVSMTSPPSSQIPWSPGQTLSAVETPWSPWSPMPREATLEEPLLEHSNSRSNPHPLSRDWLEHEEYDEEPESRGSCCCGYCCRRCWCSPHDNADNTANGEDEDIQQQRHLTTTTSTSTTNNNRSSRHNSNRRSNSCCLKLVYLGLSAATFAFLYHYTAKFVAKSFSMHPFESRQVATAGFLTDTVQIVSRTRASSDDDNSDDNNNHNNNNTAFLAAAPSTAMRGLKVYATNNVNCPPLTGAPVTVEAPPQELVLLHNAFEYQYFYLNKGSTMRVTVRQLQGATNVLVLKGNRVLARLKNKKQQDAKRDKNHNQHNSIHHLIKTTMTTASSDSSIASDLELQFEASAIMLERFSWAHEKEPIDFSFTSPASDTYVLLYDNVATNEAATLEVTYRMIMTTFNLEGMIPWCSHSSPVSSDVTNEVYSSFSCPPLDAATAGCIIVEAIEEHDSDDDGSSGNSTLPPFTNRTHVNMSGDAIVEVHTSTTRQWYYVGALSLLPSMLLFLFSFIRAKRREQQRRRRRRDLFYQQFVRIRQQEQQQRQPVQSFQQLQESEAPRFHFLLDPHHLDDSDPEHGRETENWHSDEVQEQEGRNLSQRATTNDDCPRATEATQGRDSTMIPAENVILLKKDTAADASDS